MNPNALDVFVFSYNRGAWLDNLIQSITELLAPPLDVELHVFDDHSDDEETLQVIERLRAQGTQIHHVTQYEDNLRFIRCSISIAVAVCASVMLFRL